MIIYREDDVYTCSSVKICGAGYPRGTCLGVNAFAEATLFWSLG